MFNKGYTADELLTIKRGVMQKPLPVLWTDIVGLNDMKDRLFEATTMPIVFPNFFTGIRAPYRVSKTIVFSIYRYVVIKKIYLNILYCRF